MTKKELLAQAIHHADIYSLLVYSVRYCLGRSSYAPGEMLDILKRNVHRLSEQDRAIIARDIRDELRRGDMPLAHVWTEALEVLK